MDYKEVLASFKEDSAPRYDKHTIQKVELYVTRFFEHNNKSLYELTKKDFEDWVIHLKSNNYEQSTIKSMLIELKIFFNYCVAEKILMKKPDMISVKPGIRKLRYKVTKSDWFLIKQATMNNMAHRAIFETLRSTGIRSTELCSAQREYLDLDEQLLLITKGKGRKERYVILTDECCQWLKNYLESRIDSNPLLFLTETGKYYTKTDLWKLIKKYVNTLGLCNEINVRTFRYTYASQLFQGGMDIVYIAYLLGHVSVETTKDYIFLEDEE